MGTRAHMLKNTHQILSHSSLLIFGLFSVISSLYASVYLPTQIYGSTNSGAMGDTEQKNDRILFILPDIPLTDEDVKTAGSIEFDDTSSVL
jgi:hypothetical protein